MNETQGSTQEMNITQLAASMGITDVQLAQVGPHELFHPPLPILLPSLHLSLTQVLGKRSNHPLYKTASQEYGKYGFLVKMLR